MLSFGCTTVFAYTDTEFAFKIAAEKKLKDKITTYVSQTIPREKFRVTVSASIYSIEPQLDDALEGVDDVPNVFVEGDPQDLALGLIQSKDIRLALKGRDAIIDKLKRELQNATAPTYKGVELLEVSVWLALADSINPETANLVRDQVLAFVNESYRVAPNVYVQKLNIEDFNSQPERTLASEEDAKQNTIPEWISYLLGALALFALILYVLKNKKTDIKPTLKDEFEDKALESAEPKAEEKDADKAAIPELLEANTQESPLVENTYQHLQDEFNKSMYDLSKHLQSATKDHVEKLVQFWAESSDNGKQKAALLLRSWTDLKPNEPIFCPLGAEVFEVFKVWKDLDIKTRITLAEEVLWELSAVTAMGVVVLGSKLNRIKNIHDSKALQVITETSNDSTIYVLWSLMNEEKRGKVLTTLKHATRSKVFSALWAGEEKPEQKQIDDSIQEIESYLNSKSSLDKYDASNLESSDMKKSFIASMDTRAEVELLWPTITQQVDLMNEIRSEVLNLSTFAYLKEEFWTLPDSVPTEEEFVSMSRILGTEATVRILEFMPSLTRHIYESTLDAKLKESTDVISGDFNNVDNYVARIKSQIKSQEMKVADVTQPKANWSLDSLGVHTPVGSAGSDENAA